MKDFYTRYAYYREYIEKIGSYPIDQPIKAKDLEMSAGSIQMAYKEMKAEDFKGSVVDYITWVGMMYVYTLWMERYKSWQTDPEREPINVMLDILRDNPVNTVVAVRNCVQVSIKDLKTIAGDISDWWDLVEEGFDAMMMVYYDLERLGGTEQERVEGFKNLDELHFNQLISYYQQIQSVRGGFDPSLQSRTNQPPPQTQQTDTSPQTPHTTTLSPSPKTPKTKASSDAQAERSEAFSKGRHQTPVSKGRRTTRHQKRT